MTTPAAVPTTPGSAGIIPPPPPTLATVPVVIGGVTIQKLTSKNNQRAKTVPSKYERGNLDQNDKIILFNTVTKKQNQRVFKSLPNNIVDAKQLDEFQHLDIMIEQTSSHFDHHDVADVFNIVFPDSAGNLAKESSGQT
jgi:hypothetical protein